MALISCPECGGRISDKAKNCPHCGYPVSETSLMEKTRTGEDKVKCPYCGSDNFIGIDYCVECGMRLKEYIKKDENHGEVKYRCLKCRNILPLNALTCPDCGMKVQKENELEEDVLYCPTCEGLNPIGSFSCIHCGRKYSIDDMIKCVIKAKINDVTVKVNGDTEKKAKCPRCGSTSLSANRKGFGVGKATIGTVALGLVPGLLIGSVGSKKIEVTCLKCGKRFKV